MPAIAGQPEPTTPETPGSGEPTPPPPSPATTESTAAQPAPTVAETTTPTSPPTTTNPPPPEPENTRPAPAPAATTTTGDPETDSILGPPREALVEFLAARSWQERKHLVQLPEATIPEMESYYAENPDGPVKYSSITFQNSEAVPNQDTMFYLFHVTTENVPEGFPVSVEETSGGFKIDWQAFVEFNDHHLYKFLSNYTDQPDEFHVIMRRAHFFGSDVPNLENKFAFRIEPPIPGYHGYAFVDKNSNLVDSKLSYQLQWPAISYPIVRLRWKQEATGDRYIVLDDLVQNNWRADDADINPGATASSPSRE